MKKIIAVVSACLYSYLLQAQIKPFHFAFISDTHIGSPDGKAEQDLQRTVDDINKRTDLEFVVLTGDITELGTNEQLTRAKKLLDGLKIKWFIIPGNHDDGWSESGGESFITTFGSDRFSFDHNGIRFIGCASGPYVRMSDGHIPRDAMGWMKNILDTTKADMPVVFLNHYPMDNQMDNWYEVIDMFKKKHTILFMCGHGHTNKALNFEDIPGVMGRSNLRAKKEVGGYNLVDVRTDSILFSEVNPVSAEMRYWTGVKVERHNYDAAKKYERPNYQVNQLYQNVKAKWTYASAANIISTPAVSNGMAVFGNQQGKIVALSLNNGKTIWSYQTGAAIYSSPAITNNKIVLGSTDGYVYCFDTKGKLLWKYKAGAAVLGSPVIENNIVYIGASDHQFRAIELATGKEKWNFNGLDGPVVSTPVLYKDAVIFGAWDTYLYSLNKNTGLLNWKWSNGSTVRNYSPASCIPVIHDNVIYVVAPDRYLSAIDISSGNTLWRNNASTVRESIGISGDGKYVYGKTMNDTLVAFPTANNFQQPAWKMNAGFGYEHVPSMLIERDGLIFFGTRSGVVYAVDATAQKIAWAYKIDNSMVNTVNVIDKKNIIASTMDGKVVLLRSKD
jgi:outer membrane protein assembly factor BamB/calcineurin-like phosphoesterase family protein